VVAFLKYKTLNSTNEDLERVVRNRDEAITSGGRRLSKTKNVGVVDVEVHDSRVS